jgi:tetrahydromethanopterin S-methyltransferase subunit F
MVTTFPMKKNVACKIVFPILDADGDPVSSAAGLDSEYSLDGGSFTDCASEATEIGTSGIYYLNLAEGETNGDVVCIQVKTSTSGAKTSVLVFYTSAQTLDEIDTNVDGIKTKTDLIGASVALESAGNLAAVKAKTDLIPADISTQLDTNVPAIKTKTDLIGASVAVESGGNLATVMAKTNLIPADITTQLDTNIPAVKAKTDNLPASPADETTSIAIKAKTDLIPASPANEATVLNVRKILKNRWKLLANQLIIYDDDAVTPLYTFNLKDSTGNPAMENVYERAPV